jgi:putative transport protein
VGVPLSELRLPQRFGALVTRVRRGDVDILADRDTVLELGDRVRVLAPHDRLDEVTKFFGDSYRALAEIDVLSFALGVTLGLVLGLLPLPTPLGDVRLGLAGGPLVVGLLLGRVGRTGPLVWELPFPASMTLRQLGIVLFLAVVGTRSGANLAATLAAGQSGPLFLLGALTTLSCAVPVLLVARRVLRLPLFQAFGVVAGVHTQPAVLAWAQARTPADGPARGYALVFPAATVTKILVAQVLARLVT